MSLDLNLCNVFIWFLDAYCDTAFSNGGHSQIRGWLNVCCLFIHLLLKVLDRSFDEAFDLGLFRDLLFSEDTVDKELVSTLEEDISILVEILVRVRKSKEF